MEIRFERNETKSKDYYDQVSISFKSKYQGPLIMVIREFITISHGKLEVVHGEVLWCSASLWRRPLNFFKRAFNCVKIKRNFNKTGLKL